MTRAVHPRACGERSPTPRADCDHGGSSPRVRGTDAAGCDNERGIRFIPARAGNGWCRADARHDHAVHPRACGERALGFGHHGAVSGSSPRVRGTDQQPPRAVDPGRFIPARAGNGASMFALRAEPTGSSPRVRGTGAQLRQGPEVRRFIPARAGNGARYRAAGLHRSVHPRACGERDLHPAARYGHIGSSPRVRGTAELIRALTEHHRFIPARAGNGSTPRWTPRLTTVHPRACGERAVLVPPARQV